MVLPFVIYCQAIMADNRNSIHVSHHHKQVLPLVLFVFCCVIYLITLYDSSNGIQLSPEWLAHIAPASALASASAARPVAATARRKKKPNVLFVIADDLRPEVGVYANQNGGGVRGGVYYERIHTPNIDAFARTGLVANRAYCQYALCSPSRTSFLTGN